MRLILTLLALLSGWSVSDRAVAAPAAMGAMVLLAEAQSQAEAAAEHRPFADASADRLKSRIISHHARKIAPQPRPGLLPGIDLARE